VAHSYSYENGLRVCDAFDPLHPSSNIRVLTDAEWQQITGAGNLWGAVVGGLQGSVVGGIGGAVTGPMLGVPWGLNGMAGMATGAIHGIFTGWNTPR